MLKTNGAATSRQAASQNGETNHSTVTKIVSSPHSDIEYLITFHGETLDNLEKARIAAENQLRSYEQAGVGLAEVAQVMRETVDELKYREHKQELALKKIVKSHYLYPFIKEAKGVGEKQIGRLLAAIGDPYIKPAVLDPETNEVIEQARPRRGPAELWQYCGHGDPERSHRIKGQQIEYNPEAKMRVHLIAEKCMMQSRESKYRRVYEGTRLKYQNAIHDKPCVRCGPSGHPAPIDSDLNDGHKHARALRKVGKVFLQDLFNAAQEYHLSHGVSDTQGVDATMN